MGNIYIYNDNNGKLVHTIPMTSDDGSEYFFFLHL